MSETKELAASRLKLRLSSRHLAGEGPRHPADELEAVAAWLRENGDLAHGDTVEPGVQPDVYGAGPLVEDFEAEVAALLGMEAARYFPSGTMAQPIALRIWADRAGNPNTAFHATSHLQLHEQHGYAELHGLNAFLLGDGARPTSANDLAALIGTGGAAHECGIASLLVELPAREIGGQLPAWDDLVHLSRLCRDNGIRLHMDGARLWQAGPAYGRSLAEIAALFDSAYVSFYKDVGALPGAMLLGPADFVKEAVVWQRRQGGTLYTAAANIVSARTRLMPCLDRMPRLLPRARQIAEMFARHDHIRINPDLPHTNMFHVHFTGEAEPWLAARDEVARETGIWLFGGLAPVDGTGTVKAELTIGGSALTLTDTDIAEAIALLCEKAHSSAKANGTPD